MASHHETNPVADGVKRGNAHEGPKNHFLAFGLSIALTVLAFLAVIYRHVLETWFVVSFIILLAVVQAVIQAVFWMHLKDRGHLQERIFLIGGVIVVITAVIMAIYWVWW